MIQNLIHPLPNIFVNTLHKLSPLQAGDQLNHSHCCFVGLKMSMLITSSLQMLGVAIRCIPVPVEYLRWFVEVKHSPNVRS